MDAGPVGEGINGPVALTATEIAHWCQLTQTELTPWEFQTIRRASIAWANYFADSNGKDWPAPWVTDETPTEDAMKALERLWDSAMGINVDESPSPEGQTASG